ncbi:hypothetical protein G2W53_032876 [Senna tora]|uniref:Uncharacterized protein n=1 Tax=Senna tora TaxID=362788 RepID=A0A834SX83_9FABA|nr:hypothetical protein G2W53_032876 [Senna tora]
MVSLICCTSLIKPFTPNMHSPVLCSYRSAVGVRTGAIGETASDWGFRYESFHANGIIGVFMNYGQYKEHGVGIDEENPLFWLVAQPLAESIAHDMLLRLGHQPGRSRFSLLCHNNCSTRDTHLPAATNIVAKAITSGTLLPAHISIKGRGTNEDDESQNPYSTSPSIEVFTCLLDALEISWLMSSGMLPSIRTHMQRRLQSTHDPPACNKIWKLNEIRLEAFLKGLDSTSEHEADDEVVLLPVPPPTYKGKGKEKVNTFDVVDVNERRKTLFQVSTALGLQQLFLRSIQLQLSGSSFSTPNGSFLGLNSCSLPKAHSQVPKALGLQWLFLRSKQLWLFRSSFSTPNGSFLGLNSCSLPEAHSQLPTALGLQWLFLRSKQL